MLQTRIHRWDFLGAIAVPATASPGPLPWCKVVTLTAGTPTVAGNGNALRLALDATNEVQNLCLYFGDSLAFDIDDLLSFKICLAASSLSSATKARWGLASARNADPDAIAQSLFFGLSGGLTLTAESDDGTNEVAATSTGITVTADRFNVYEFRFGGVKTGDSPTGGKSQIELFAEDINKGRRVLPRTNFNLGAYSGGLQPFVQLQKTASTNTGNLDVKFVEVVERVAA